MLALILSWLMKPKVLASVLLIAALSGAFFWYGAKREADGFSAGKRSQLDEDKVLLAQQAKSFQDTLNQQQAIITKEDALLNSLNDSLKVTQAQLVALSSQRQSQQQSVAALPDAKVQADLEAKLGGLLSQTETLRKADSIVTDYPLVVKQSETLTAQVKDEHQKVDVLQTELTAVTKQRDAAITFSNEVMKNYVDAYNAAQKHHSLFVKIITLGLVHDKHLKLPNPVEIHVPTIS